MMSFLLLYLLSQTIFVQSQLLYSDAEVTEVIGYKRSIEGEREFHIKFGNESVDLDLVSSDGLLPKTLSVNVLDVDDDGNLVIDDWVHTTNGGKEIYVDFKHSASLLIEENNGRPELKGKLNEKLYIQPNKEDNSRKGRHSIYQLKPKATLETRSNDDVESVPISENQSDSQSGSSHEKRQQLSQIYVPLHIVVDFDLYSLIGYNPANVIEYVKTFVGAINAYFALIQQPRVQISIQAIDIYKSKAAASTIEQHRNYADNGLICGEVLKTYRKWANTERSRIGDNYAAIFILTGSKSMCDQPQNNQCNIGIAGDDYSYNGVQDATHEVGHL
ncbi:hypothetical protein EB796_003126 [Bugula neritina]|uniref:Peptidase M12B domain-containing protein n=1 Tax=Bugula neritina TaxID=10212 RepID=A0A7J7KKU3_BUGNE|nr:hypothetical protein EB796_003126 [Bugula neritina]